MRRATFKPTVQTLGFALSLCCVPALAANSGSAGSSFTLEATTDQDQALHGTAFAIAPHGWLVTRAEIVDRATRVTLTFANLETREAKIVAVDSAAGLALLKIAGEPTPLRFAASETDGESAAQPVRVDAGTFLNQCGEVLGIELSDTASISASDIAGRYAVAATANQIDTLAAKSGVVLNRVTLPCVSALAHATDAAAAAQSRAAAAECKAAALRASASASNAEREAAEQDARGARDAANAAENNRHKAERDAAAARRSAERGHKEAAAAAEVSRHTRKIAMWAGVAAMAVLILIAAGSFFLIRRGRRKQRLAEMAARAAMESVARATTPPKGARDLLLEGITEDGERLALKVPALALGEAHGGAVIGRNPDSAEFVVNRDRVSRRHCRLFVSQSELQIEDLNSTNGTRVNGQAMQSPSRLNDGDRIGIGDIEFRLVIRDTDAGKAG